MHLDRLAHILETVASAGRPVAAAAIYKATGLPRPTAYRLLQSLTEHRLLDAVEGGYLVGARLTRIALMGQSDQDVSRLAEPAMRQAARDLGEAVFLARFREAGVEIIRVELPADPARSYMHPGLGVRPMHACSCSKAIAAFADEAFRQSIVDGPMRDYTEHTKTDPAAIAREFLAIQSCGYAECVQEIELGVSSVAAPIRVGPVGAPFSVGATGPVRRFTEPRRAEIGRQLIDVGQKIAAALQLDREAA
ncbi:Transcriptional regulator, IclR family [Candidatus Rhodobacter oscarellae]|uniref:Transcriptional regulator, IclR family n=1 Tax=Candidatus Rhodobacter oscarellae TaxID=1675527 RepID=A0A0J9E7I2_9RHOB|nr:IclR family transcriptional regulator [Candidatus Rhodobacter lobularis]KMW58657.1 Transcriptional regulator, IclR family [Candidatus Rhodobacter lobularis]